jgi:tetratricopeptide (TPR) repeat protein
MALAAVERTIPIFEAAGSHAGLALASRLKVGIYGTANRFAESVTAAEQVISESKLAGDPRLERRGAVGYAQAALYGPTPVDEAIARCEELAAAAVGDRRTEALIRHSLVQLYGMQGKFDLARTTWGEANQMLNDLGMGLFSAAISTSLGQVELLAGDLDAAERVLERGYASLHAMGGKFLLAGVAGLLGRVNHAQGRFDKVEEHSRTVESLADTDDIDAQTEWRCLRALSLAHDGKTDEAVELAKAGVELSRAADAPLLLAGALVTLGEVEGTAGHAAERDDALQQALALYQAKGDLVSTRMIESRLTVDAGA